MSRTQAGAGALAISVLLGAGAARADYQFLAAPQIDLNRLYRVERTTGEVAACQFGVQDGTTGVTFCYPAGDGAGPQEPGEYELVASNHTRESGVFRVDKRSGRVSICYVLQERVICTGFAR